MKVPYILAWLLSCLLVVTSASAQKPPSTFQSTVNLDVMQQFAVTECPLHGNNMKLSDNYRPEGDTIRDNTDYPYAYQLGFRRYCNKCTRALTKEIKQFRKEEQNHYKKSVGTFERCTLHGEQLQPNKYHDPVDYISERSRLYNEEYPHARDYRHRWYCPSCTKGYGSIEDEKERERQKEEARHIDE